MQSQEDMVVQLPCFEDLQMDSFSLCSSYSFSLTMHSQLKATGKLQSPAFRRHGQHPGKQGGA